MLHWPKKSLVMSFYYINFDQNGPPYSPLTELTDPVSSPSLPSEKFSCRITVTCDLLGDWDGEPRGRASCSSSLSRSALLV